MAVLTEEQQMLRDAAEAWAQERAPVSAFRKLRNSRAGVGYDPVLFREMANMGWTGVLVPEKFGGADFGYLSMGLVLEQLGRTLTQSPLVSSSLAAVSGLRRAGSAEQQQEWLPQISEGALVACLAIDEGPRHGPATVALTAVKKKNAWRLNGEKRPVLHGMAANVAIVAARTSGAPGETKGVTLFLVRTDAPGLTREALSEIERRGAAIFAFKDVELNAASVLGAVGEGYTTLDHMLDCARAGIAAEMLGGAQQAFDTTLDYLKTRVQFGRVIGSFQALQHRAAALAGELELMRSAVENALAALDADSKEAPELVSLAKAIAGDTFRRVAGEMIQLHGGIGMTDEHDAGLYLKRARIADLSYGGAAFHRERYAALLGY